MKKAISLFLALCLGFSLSACGPRQTPAAAGGPVDAAAPGAPGEPAGETGLATDLTIVSGSTGGVWAVIAEGMSECFRGALPEGANVNTNTGNDAANVSDVSQGVAELGLAYYPTALNAREGADVFEGNPQTNAYALCSLFPAIYQFFILKSTGITSFAQMAEEGFPLAVGCNTAGSMMHLFGAAVLAEYGMDAAALEQRGGKILTIAQSPTLDMMGSGDAHALSQVATLPISGVIEFSTTKELTLLPLDQRVVDAMAARYDVTPYTIPADTYDFLTEDVQSFATSCLVMINGDVSEETAYTLAKAMVENIGYFGSVSQALAGLTPEYLADTGAIPLHPGAEAYFREIGALP